MARNRGVWFQTSRVPMDQDVSESTSEYPWEHPTGPRHILAIAVAKRLLHHSFFSCDAAKEQNPEAGQARETGNPVRQQQCLGDRPQPKCRIHGVSNSPVNSFRDKFMLLPHVQTDQPVPTECTVSQVKHAQSRNCNERPQPSQGGIKAVSCETGYCCSYVDERNKSKSRKRYE